MDNATIPPGVTQAKAFENFSKWWRNEIDQHPVGLRVWVLMGILGISS